MADTYPKEIAWQLQLPDRLPIIQADPVRLRQIVLNLLSNARKFTTSGQIVLGAEVDPPHLHLWVQDTGSGIPVEMQERIFEPFVTVERLGRRSEGIGLGLSITRRLVALHGGSMSLESRMGQGSTFHVYLPLPNLSGKFSAPPAGMLKPVLLLLSTGQETSPTLLNLAAQMNLPVRKISAPSELDAILKETIPTVLAWDILSARQDEWELVEHIRRHPKLCQLPFIVYREEPGGEIETTEVLVKPVASKTLLEAVIALRPIQGAGPILIVDDEAETREFYQRLVNESLPGYTVLSAESGTLALAAIQKTTPSLVILDLMMPEMDGFVVLEKIRSQPETRQVPILVMSGKLLSAEDIRRLNYARVTFSTKKLLSNDEAAALLRKILKPEEALPQPTSVLVKAALAYLHQNYAQPVTRQKIAQAVGVSSSYLSRIFHQEVGLSAWDCLNRFRVLKARELLCNSTATVTAIAGQVGFDDSAYFSRIFRKYTGQSPQAYRQMGKIASPPRANSA